MPGQGQVFSEDNVKQIIHLLKTTELSISEIAEHMGCSRSLVVSVNRRYVVRCYNGRRAEWTVEDKAS